MAITVLFALYLVALAVVLFAAVRLFTIKDAEGRTQPLGCAMGCFTGLVLIGIGLAGLAGFLAATTIHTSADVIDSIPVRSVTVVSEDGPDDPPVQPFHDPDRPLHLIFEVIGSEEPIEYLEQWAEEHFHGDARVEVTKLASDAPGRPDRMLVDVAVRASRRDLRELERAAKNFLPRLDLDEGVRVRMHTAQDW